jgi:hypothetical protein
VKAAQIDALKANIAKSLDWISSVRSICAFQREEVQRGGMPACDLALYGRNVPLVFSRAPPLEKGRLTLSVRVVVTLLF